MSAGTKTSTKKINTPCPHCGREEHQDFKPLGTWYDPCPADDCPSNNQNKDKMGYCPKCGERDWEVDESGSDIEAWTDDTPFPTITIRFKCQECSHEIEVSYDRENDLHDKSNKEESPFSYDPDPKGELDLGSGTGQERRDKRMGRHICDNCGWRGPESELDEIEDLERRVEPGGVVPSGQCPECGALAYPEDIKH